MNAVFLIIIPLAVFALGYRYFAKWLQVAVFTPAPYKYSTWSPPGAETPSPGVLFGYHSAAIATAGTLSGSAVAVIWGWVPAFLWVVVGTVVGAGTLGLGGFWLARRYPGRSLAELMADRLPPAVTGAARLLLLAFLVIAGAGLAWLLARLLVIYPAATLAFWLQLPLAWLLARYWHWRGERAWRDAPLVLAVLVALVWLGAPATLAFSGALNLDISGRTRWVLDAGAVWLVLLLVAAFFAGRAPLPAWSRPRGFIAAVHMAVLLAVLFAGVLLAAPAISAPDFNELAGGPRAVPLLFIVVTSGAVAGFHALIILGLSAPQLPAAAPPGRLRLLGYGGALADGVVALSAITVCAAGFSDREAWQNFYGDWREIQDIPALLQLYVNGAAHFAAELGIPKDFARNFAAVGVMGLLAITLEALARLLWLNLKHHGTTFIPGEARPPGRWTGAALGLLAVAAFADGRGAGGLILWPLAEPLNQLLALMLLLVLAGVLRRQAAARRVVAILGLVLLVLINGGLLARLHGWWAGGEWGFFAAGAAILGAEIMLLAAGLRGRIPGSGSA